jgi:hypothetical protein
MEYCRTVPQQSARPLITANPCPSVKSKETQEYFISNHELPVNHRILAADLNWSGRENRSIQPNQFLEKYMACAVRGNEPVVLQEVSDTPAIRPSTGKSEYPLPLTGHLTFDSSLDVDSQIDLFEDNRRLLQKVLVLAVQCTGPGNDDCVAIVELSASDGELLSRGDASKLRIVRLRP